LIAPAIAEGEGAIMTRSTSTADAMTMTPRETQGADRITYAIAMAAGQDAGNRSMRASGRTSWNEDDWNAAAAETERLMALIP
jgi:hypothetical protein